MRRLMVGLCAAGLLVGLVSVGPASASKSAGRETPTALHDSWIQWAFGSSGAPLLQPDFCGEVIDGVFYMTVAGGAPTSINRRVDCEIPAYTPILTTPGGNIVWAPTDGKTDQALRKSLFASLTPLLVRSVRVKVDGGEIDHGPLAVPDPHDIALEPGNLIETVDPGVTGDSTRIADGFYFELLQPLAPGDHVIVTSDKFDYRDTGGELVHYRTRFAIHVS
jgi:hypothetical protein